MTVDGFAGIGTEHFLVFEGVGEDPDGQEDTGSLLLETLTLLDILGGEILGSFEVLAEIGEVGEETEKFDCFPQISEEKSQKFFGSPAFKPVGFGESLKRA